MVLNTLLVSKMKWKSSQDENAFKNESTCKKLSWKKVNAFLIKTVNCWENVIKYGKKSLTAFKKDLIVNQCTIKIFKNQNKILWIYNKQTFSWKVAIWSLMM